MLEPLTHAIRLLEGLKEAVHARLRVRIRKPVRGGVRGAGAVTNRDEPGGALVVESRGAWANLDGVQAPFSDALRWMPRPNGEVRVEHLRRGATQPVRLVDLVTRDGIFWTTREPHICDRDQYTATAIVGNDGVRVRWRIRGPRKAMVVETWYTR
jgi:Family of unknown function (DUF6314)